MREDVELHYPANESMDDDCWGTQNPASFDYGYDTDGYDYSDVD